MTFLHPILLGAGGACVAIPVIIHLLMRRRRKPVRWAAMRFLREASQQRRRRVRLEHLVLLVARCLLVALIALAVAHPMFGRRDAATAGARELFILLDNSLAAATADADGATELDAAIERARSLLDSLDPARGDRAALITLGGPAQVVVSPPTADLGLVERRLAELRPTDSPMDLAGGIALVPVAPVAGGPVRSTIAVFSAFRAGSVGRAPPLGALPPGVRLVADPPTRITRANAGVTALSLLRPVLVAGGGDLLGGAGQARASLLRSGERVDQADPTTVRVLALTDGAPREVGRTSVRWTPGQTDAHATIDLDMTGLGATGRIVLQAEIDHDNNGRDNRAWAVIELRERLRVAVVGTRRFGTRPRLTEFGPSDWVQLALEPAESRSGRDASRRIEPEVLDAASLHADSLAGFDAAIVVEPARVRSDGWTALGAFRAGGGMVLLTVSPIPGAQLWTEPAAVAFDLDWTLDRDPTDLRQADRALAVPTPDGEDPLWFLRSELSPLAETVTIDRRLGVDAPDAMPLLTAGGGPILLASSTASGAPRVGRLYLLTTAIDLGWTDLPARPLMVPLVQELVRSSVRASVSHATAGVRVVAPAGAVEIADRNEAGERPAAVDPTTGLTRQPIRLAGAYVARDRSGADVGAVAVQPDGWAGQVGVVTRGRVGAWLSAGAGADRFAWSDTGEPAAPSGRPEASAAGPGPGLTILLSAAALACVELGLARVVSHASRTGAAA